MNNGTCLELSYFQNVFSINNFQSNKSFKLLSISIPPDFQSDISSFKITFVEPNCKIFTTSSQAWSNLIETKTLFLEKCFPFEDKGSVCPKKAFRFFTRERPQRRLPYIFTFSVFCFHFYFFIHKCPKRC